MNVSPRPLTVFTLHPRAAVVQAQQAIRYEGNI